MADPVNKFSETADRFKRFKAAREERLDALNERMDAHESNEDQVFRSYEGAVEEFEEQMKAFEEDAKNMRNAIDHKDEEKVVDKLVDAGGQTDSTVTKFPATGEQVKAS